MKLIKIKLNEIKRNFRQEKSSFTYERQFNKAAQSTQLFDNTFGFPSDGKIPLAERLKMDPKSEPILSQSMNKYIMY